MNAKIEKKEVASAECRVPRFFFGTKKTTRDSTRDLFLTYSQIIITFGEYIY